MSNAGCHNRTPELASLIVLNSQTNILSRHPAVASRSIQPLNAAAEYGAGRDRTDDLLVANQALSQLSYGPRDQQTDSGT